MFKRIKKQSQENKIKNKNLNLIATIFAVILFSMNVSAQQNYVANLSSAQEVVPNASTGRGEAWHEFCSTNLRPAAAR